MEKKIMVKDAVQMEVVNKLVPDCVCIRTLIVIEAYNLLDFSLKSEEWEDFIAPKFFFWTFILQHWGIDYSQWSYVEELEIYELRCN